MNTTTQSPETTVTKREPNGQVPFERYVQPRASVFGAQDAVTIELEMPGVVKDKVEITVEQDELTITGYRQVEDYSKHEVLHQERVPFNYRRSFVLSETIDSGKIQANLENGVLKLTLPKAETAKPRKIAVQ
ncbi:MAG: Hsp20/alpha crystallin family protein [Candidatus Sumerlaeaceae bacterium]|nr:Hsp20/alpha crystallin family protein [Candidatus Sumerlaeaceae bacterium]